jgi:sterol desaturase/sphingolipid hydroxylase (fatty acid hydroxylase superfamily)
VIAALERGWSDLTHALYAQALQPALYALGLMEWADDAYAWLDFAVLGAVQIILIWLVCRPLEAWRPVERWDDRRAVATDILYTLLTRLGLLPLIVFVAFRPAQTWLHGSMADAGWTPLTLEALLPVLREHPWLAFAAYVLVLDLGDYWRHRLQHALPWWWALHSVHHAQRQMTFWTDDRNHLLDDLLAGLWFGALALLIGVPPGQFPLIILLLRFVEALSHANVRLNFGPLGERLIVSPRFHRIHHGELSAGAQGRNYAVLLPLWDWLFRTADFRRDDYPATGDPTGPEVLASGGWWAQQKAGARRMAVALRTARPGARGALPASTPRRET